MTDRTDIPSLQVIQGGSSENQPTGNLGRLAELQEERRGGGRQSAASVLIAFAKDLRFFHTADHVAHVSVVISNRRQVWPVRSAQFKSWLRHRYNEATDGAAPSQALEDAIGVLEARAEFQAEEEPVELRVGSGQGAQYIDLGTTSGPTVVKVTATGWEALADSPVHFSRPKALLPLPVPERDGTIEELREFINVKSDPMFMLLVVWLVSALMGSMPVPVLVIQGLQGSAKSTLLRVIRMLVDPAKGVLRGQPRHEHDLAIAASKSWLVTYDNLSFIPDWLSDAFCRIVTGGAFAARQLFSDGEEIIFEYRRPAILNGIEELVTRSDLLDRAVVLNLPKIEETDRRDEEEFWADFEEARPRILGALLDALAGVMRELPSVVLPRKPRMADFAKVGVAVETALGWPPGSFMAAYTGNRSVANEIAIEASLIGPFIRALAAQPRGWTGTPEALLKRLDELYTRSRAGLPVTGSLGFNNSVSPGGPKPKNWPSNAQQLSAKLQRIMPNLAEVGVVVERGQTPGSNSTRTIRIFLAALTSDPPAAPPAATPPPSPAPGSGVVSPMPFVLPAPRDRT
ncbi:MAG: hypothetical protein NDI82_00325 [Anaeromyxobacteraceae bacterium]|nr:hypothetical protein [Anaeromyxobacteraceae bacterium]